MKKEMSLLLVSVLFVFSGCDRVYFPEYVISSKEELDRAVLCAKYNDPNQIIDYVNEIVKSNEFEGIKVFNVNPDAQSYHITNGSESYGSVEIRKDNGNVILGFHSWNPGAYEGEPIRKTKIYEKYLIDELRQQECFEIENNR